jgi:hypothetical protein
MTTSPFLGRLRTMTLIERDSSTQARFPVPIWRNFPTSGPRRCESVLDVTSGLAVICPESGTGYVVSANAYRQLNPKLRSS